MYFKYWELDSKEKVAEHYISARASAIEDDETLAHYSFKVRRRKEKETKIEEIEIDAYVDGEENGIIKSRLSELESRLIKFRDYGVVLSRIKYHELASIISENLLCFEAEAVEGIDSEISLGVAADIVDMLCEYIDENSIEMETIAGRDGTRRDLYNISVDEFNRIIFESDYCSYSSMDIRRVLRDEGYIYTNRNRFEYVIKREDKPVKVVSIYRETVENRRQ